MKMQIPVERTKSPKAKPTDSSKLGFGNYYTDHMFLMNYDAGQGWHDPRIVPYGSIALDPAAMCLHYGQEVFEGMKAYHTPDGGVALFRPEKNMARMNLSNDRLCIPPIDEEFAVEAVKELVRVDQDWIPDGEGTALYIHRAGRHHAGLFLRGHHPMQGGVFQQIHRGGEEIGRAAGQQSLRQRQKNIVSAQSPDGRQRHTRRRHREKGNDRRENRMTGHRTDAAQRPFNPGHRHQRRDIPHRNRRPARQKISHHRAYVRRHRSRAGNRCGKAYAEGRHPSVHSRCSRARRHQTQQEPYDHQRQLTGRAVQRRSASCTARAFVPDVSAGLSIACARICLLLQRPHHPAFSMNRLNRSD